MNARFVFTDDLLMMDPGFILRMVEPERIAAANAFGQKLGEHAGEPDYVRRIRDALAPKVEISHDGVAVIPIDGPLAFAPDPFEMLFYGVEDSRAVERAVKMAATSPEVSAIMLRINSPGGQIMGGAEMAEAVSAASKRKPVMAHASGMMASLAYLVGSQAGAGIYAIPSAQVGSIGVIFTAIDRSRMLEAMGVKVEVITNRAAKFKAIGNPTQPMTEDGRSHLRERAESAFGAMRDTILSARPKIPDDSMQGQVFTGREAQKAGLVDAIGSFDFAMAALRNRIGK